MSHLHTDSLVEKRPKTSSTPPELRSYEYAILRITRIVCGETLIYKPGTPISYTFHSCDIILIREALRLIHTGDLSMNLNLKTMTFSLPKHLDDAGSAVPWLVSLATCLAWCFQCSSVPDIVITEPELGVKEPCITVNETGLPEVRTDLHPGSTGTQTSAGLSTTATDLVHLFLCFAQGLPSTESATEEQAIFALADFLHNRPDKCKSCILWRAAWKECLKRLYGEVVAKSMAKRRKFQSA